MKTHITLDWAPSTISIEDIGYAHDIGFDRFHRQEPAGRDLLEGDRVRDGIDTAKRHLERGVIAEVDVGEGEGVGRVGAAGDHEVFGFEKRHKEKTYLLRILQSDQRCTILLEKLIGRSSSVKENFGINTML